MKLNAPKTQPTTISGSNYESALNLSEALIELTDSLEILCVIQDRKLTFWPHINKEQLRKVCSKGEALRRIHCFIPQHVIVRLYKAYSLPLEYCSPLFIGIGEMEKNKLEDTNWYLESAKNNSLRGTFKNSKN